MRSLHRYLRQQQDRNCNCNHNWNWWSRMNTNRKTVSTNTGNHPKRRKRNSIRKRGMEGSLLQELGRWMWRHHEQRGGGDIWSIFVIAVFVVDICVWYFLKCRGEGRIRISRMIEEGRIQQRCPLQPPPTLTLQQRWQMTTENLRERRGQNKSRRQNSNWQEMRRRRSGGVGGGVDCANEVKYGRGGLYK